MIPLTTEDTQDVKSYQRRKLWAIVASTLLSLSVLAIMAFLVGPRMSRWLHEHIGDNRWLQLLVAACVVGGLLELVMLPISFYSGYWLEHRYDLSNQTLGKWIWRKIKSYIVGGVLGAIFLAGLYALIWWTGSWWWVWAAIGWLTLTLILGRIVPVLILPLFYKVTRLEESELEERFRNLTEGTGLTVEGVYRLHLSEETKKANAALAGMGSTRRVLLGDTLLEQFSPEEIEVVFAHEVGHHVHKHLPKMIAVSVVLTVCGLWLVDFVGRWTANGLGYTGLADPAALPLLLLVLAVFGLVLSPAQNALSRYFEIQCDQYALDKTKNPDAYRSAFEKLASINKADTNPHPLVVTLFYDHPPIQKRLEMAGE